MTTLADALAGGGTFVKWADLGVGHTVTGTITATELRQARKFGTTEPDAWDDGKPKMQAVITLATDLREDAEDDGTRNVSINLWSGQKKALAQACRDAGVPEPVVGQKFTATWASGAGTAASPREFTYVLGPAPSPLAAVIDTTPPAQPATPAASPAASPAKPLGEQAKEYLAQGLDVATVATMTGLPAATVAALANTV